MKSWAHREIINRQLEMTTQNIVRGVVQPSWADKRPDTEYAGLSASASLTNRSKETKSKCALTKKRDKPDVFAVN